MSITGPWRAAPLEGADGWAVVSGPADDPDTTLIVMANQPREVAETVAAALAAHAAPAVVAFPNLSGAPVVVSEIPMPVGAGERHFRWQCSGCLGPDSPVALPLHVVRASADDHARYCRALPQEPTR